jgi:hypothetical protein
MNEEYDSILAAKMPAPGAGEREKPMRSLGIVVTTLAVAVSLPISAGAVAQNATADAEAQAREQARQNAITDRYLTAVQVEMASKVDTKNAVVGQEVSARTLQETRLANGMTLPKGTRLVGHVIQVKAGGPEQGSAILTLTFDHAEVKGQNVAVRCVIRAVAPNAAAAASREMMAEQPPMIGPSSGSVGTTGRGSGRGGVAGGMPGTTVPTVGGGRPVGSTLPPIGTTGTPGTSGGGMGGTTVPSVADSGPVIGGRAADMSSLGGPATATPNRRVSDAGESVSQAPRATGLPGVMLWASPTASGTLTAMDRNISLESGMQITLGVITH